MGVLEAVRAILAAWKDPMITIGTIIAGIVAILGLRTWRKEVRGSANLEVARLVLKSASVFAAAFEGMRFPKPLYYSSDSAFSHQDAERAFLDQAFKERYQLIGRALVGLEVSAIEAEALWGPGCRNLVGQLKTFLIPLALAVANVKYLSTGNLSADEEAKARQILGLEEGPHLEEHIRHVEEQLNIIRESAREHLP